MGKNTAKDGDLKIAFGVIMASLAENSPEKSPAALMGAGMMSGIILCLTDGPLMERIIKATMTKGRLTASKASAESIVDMFRALEEIHDKGLAGHEAGVKARQRILGVKPPS